MSGRHWIATAILVLAVGIALAILYRITPPVFEIPQHPTPTPELNIQLPTI